MNPCRSCGCHLGTIALAHPATHPPVDPRGGPVFNAAGQFSGLALSGDGQAASKAMDDIYEASLKVCLQVLSPNGGGSSPSGEGAARTEEGRPERRGRGPGLWLLT